MNKGIKIAGIILGAVAGSLAGAYLLSEKKRSIKAYMLKKKKQVQDKMKKGNPFEPMPNIFV